MGTDLWHGRQTDHEDIEFTIIRSDLPFFCKALFRCNSAPRLAETAELLPAHRARLDVPDMVFGHRRALLAHRHDAGTG